jgi:hypothetical protein
VSPHRDRGPAGLGIAISGTGVGGSHHGSKDNGCNIQRLAKPLEDTPTRLVHLILLVIGIIEEDVGVTPSVLLKG